jgi:hypothetical protein
LGLSWTTNYGANGNGTGQMGIIFCSKFFAPQSWISPKTGRFFADLSEIRQFQAVFDHFWVKIRPIFRQNSIVRGLAKI